MPNQFSEDNIEEILYLKHRPDGGFDIVKQGQEDIIKVTFKNGQVIWAYPNAQQV